MKKSYLMPTLLLVVCCMAGCTQTECADIENTEIHSEIETEKAAQSTEQEDTEIIEENDETVAQAIEPEDIPEDSILCENLLADLKNGYGNEEICSFYEDFFRENEADTNPDNASWQIRYAEYDINADDIEDYIVILEDNTASENGKISVHILLTHPKDDIVCVRLPEGGYQKNAHCDMMLLDSGDCDQPWIALEETDISGLDWEETKELLQQKYPEFTFWREG